jgi:hypothetical protein
MGRIGRRSAIKKDPTTMAIDPTLSLTDTFVKIPNPMDHALALRNQVQQGQINAQQLQSGQQEIDQRKIQMDQAAAVNKAYTDAMTIDPTSGKASIDTDGLTRALAGSGHGAAIPGIMKGVLETQESAEKLSKAKLENQSLQADLGGSVGATVQAANNDPNLFLSLAQHAVDSKAVDEASIKPITDKVRDLLAQDPTGELARPVVAAAAQHLITSSPKQTQLATAAAAAKARQQTADAATAREAREAKTADVKLPGEQATADALQFKLAGQTAPNNQADWTTWRAALPPKIGAQVPAMFSPAGAAQVQRLGMTPDEQVTTDETAKRDQQTKDNETANQKLRDREIRIQQHRTSIEQKKYDATFGQGLDANGRPLSPEERKTVAQRDPTAVAQAAYQIPPPSRTTAVGKAQWDKILSIEPTYDGTKFAERNKIAQDYSASGVTGKAITSTDTALAHLDSISQAGKALRSNDLPMLNKLATSLGVQAGRSAPVVYDAIVETVAPEISKAVIGGVGGVEDRQKMKDSFSRNNNDEAREGAIGAVAGLLGARVHKQAQAYESDMGKPLARKLSPESQAVLDRYSGGGQGGAPAAGTVSKGYKFKGGDPADQKNWEKQ